LDALLRSDFAIERLTRAGMSAPEAVAKADRFASAAMALIAAGQPRDAAAVAVFVPGRIEVLGKHTDYCGGRSLVCTVERGMCFVAIPRFDNAIRFAAIDLNDTAVTALDPALQPAVGHWSNYPATVARRVARNFATATTGADIAMSSDLPPASGLSSSSAMIVGCFLVLARINGLSQNPTLQRNIKTREDLAGYLGCIENGESFRDFAGDRGVGTFGGSQDHTAILCSKPGKLSVYSFCPVSHERDVDLPTSLNFLIADTGIVAEKTGAALEKYNRVSLRARRLVGLWNESRAGSARCLREAVTATPQAAAELQELARRAAVDMDLVERLEQFLVESARLIPAAADAIARNELDALGPVVDESQHLAETQLQNQVQETIELQRLLRETGAVAASAFGAGFGGSVWGLFRESDVGAARERLKDHRTFITRPGCAAFEL
jgi:galactokinase